MHVDSDGVIIKKSIFRVVVVVVVVVKSLIHLPMGWSK